ncbi:MAG: tetratricopeptide repeat protein, partial [Desulfuromonadales bacterium]|nr:tetratricopeptide repeat protein [Desulfuromonadales bacterium]
MLIVVLCLALGCQVTPRTGPGAAAPRDPALPFGELDASSENRIEALAQFATGVSVQLTEDLDRALPYYQEAVRLDPHNVKHGAELAKLLLARKQIDEAVVLLQDLITQNPDAAEPHFVLGVIHNTREQPAEALAAFELAYRLDPTSIDTVQALLHRYLQDDQTDAAGRLLKRALKVKADKARYWLRLADFCVTTRRQAPSLASVLSDDHIAACLEKGLALADDEEEPTRSDFLARLATLYEQAGDEEQAGRYYEQLAEAKPDDV